MQDDPTVIAMNVNEARIAGFSASRGPHVPRAH